MSRITLKCLIRKFLERRFPDALFVVRAARMRRGFRKNFKVRQGLMAKRLYDSRAPFVLCGPFKGMRYLSDIVWGPIECKWLGTYEQELHPIIERIVRADYPVIIDAGSAEGYYSVGLAMRCPRARVLSYDVDPWARRQQRQLAALNGVTNLEIYKHCSGEELASRISDHTLLVCDIEGYEYDLLDPVATHALRKCDILVEMHAQGEKGLTPGTGADELTRRFASSHRVTRLDVRPRSGDGFDDSLLSKLTADELADCLDERRPQDQIWLWLEAYVPPAGPTAG